MEASCKIRDQDGAVFEKNQLCTPWAPTGSSLKAFASDVDQVLVDFDLAYPVYFEEKGSVEFKYHKDTIGSGLDAYGVF